MTIKEHEHTWMRLVHEEEGRIYSEESGELLYREESFCLDGRECNAGLVTLVDGRRGIIDNAKVDVKNWFRPTLPKDYKVDFVAK